MGVGVGWVLGPSRHSGEMKTEGWGGEGWTEVTSCGADPAVYNGPWSSRSMWMSCSRSGSRCWTSICDPQAADPEPQLLPGDLKPAPRPFSRFLSKPGPGTTPPFHWLGTVHFWCPGLSCDGLWPRTEQGWLALGSVTFHTLAQFVVPAKGYGWPAFLLPLNNLKGGGSVPQWKKVWQKFGFQRGEWEIRLEDSRVKSEDVKCRTWLRVMAHVPRDWVPRTL